MACDFLQTLQQHMQQQFNPDVSLDNPAMSKNLAVTPRAPHLSVPPQGGPAPAGNPDMTSMIPPGGSAPPPAAMGGGMPDIPGMGGPSGQPIPGLPPGLNVSVQDLLHLGAATLMGLLQAGASGGLGGGQPGAPAMAAPMGPGDPGASSPPPGAVLPAPAPMIPGQGGGF